MGWSSIHEFHAEPQRFSELINATNFTMMNRKAAYPPTPVALLDIFISKTRFVKIIVVYFNVTFICIYTLLICLIIVEFVYPGPHGRPIDNLLLNGHPGEIFE